MSRAQRLAVIQGEFAVGTEAGLVLTTVLGSCVAACLHDPKAGLGGMNHFLLPDAPEDAAAAGVSARAYGAFAMERLINALLAKGAVKTRLEAKLFGGGRMFAGLGDVGLRNADFARRFLNDEAIPLISCSLGGDRGRRVEFEPGTGRARQTRLGRSEAAQLATAPLHLSAARPPAVGGLELF